MMLRENVNEVLFRYRSGIYVKTGQDVSQITRIIEDAVHHKEVLVSGIMNIMSLGYKLDDKLFNRIQKLPIDQLSKELQDIYDIIYKALGADVVTEPMYPNFPEQVIEMDELEFYFNAILHYISGGEIVFKGYKDPREKLRGGSFKKLRLIENREEYDKVFINMMESEAILSIEDRDYLIEYLGNSEEVEIPKNIPIKETCALVENVLLKRKGYERKIKHLLRTPTDILRLMAAYSDCDVSLRKYIKFKTMPRYIRRFILSSLNRMTNILEDMYRHEELWIKAGEILHPTEDKMAKVYTNVAKAFNSLRNEKKPLFYSGKLEAAFLDIDVDSVLKLLVQRPGEFVRNFNRIMTMCIDIGEEGKVIGALQSIGNRVSSRVLIQLYEYIINRDNEYRVFKPAGENTSYYAIENTQKVYSEKLDDELKQLILKLLIGKYINRPYMGRVYIDQGLKDIAIPLSSRENKGGFRVLPQYSRIALSREAKVIRGFLHWKNAIKAGEEIRTDEDLSILLLDKEYGVVDYISYYNFKSEYGVHSGDFIDAPYESGGATEYLDLDIEKCKGKVSYAAFIVQGYNGIPFDKMEDCCFGWMEREDMQSGEVFEPSTVELLLHASGNTCCLGYVIDIDRMEVIWLNKPINNTGALENAYYARKTIIPFLKQELEYKHFSLKLLANIHAMAHGYIVETMEEADIIFSMDEGITPYDTDKILELI